MQVLLREDVKGLGRKGDLVSVAKGYARNHLIPSGAGVEAKDGTVRQAEDMKRGRALREAQDRETAQEQAGLLNGREVVITARAHDGKLFGSVGKAEVAEAITDQTGVQVDRKHVQLGDAIRVLGSTEVVVELFADVAATVTVTISEG